MWTSPLAIAGLIMTLIVCAFALAVGSRTERLGAGFVLLDYILSNVPGLFTHEYIELRFLVSGLICLAGLLSLCWKARHPWPLWAVAAQLAGVAAQVNALRHTEVLVWTSLTIQILSGYGVLLALLIGTFAAMRKQKRR